MASRMFTWLTVGLALACSIGAQPRPDITPRAAQALRTDDPTTPHKYWLFFDSSAAATSPMVLTEKARARRAKVDPINLLVDKYDYALRPEVLDSVRQSGAILENVSRWFRAVSVQATPPQMERLMQNRGLRAVDLVPSFTISRPNQTRPTRMPSLGTGVGDLQYGSSLRQNLFVKAVKMHRAGYTGKGVLVAMFDAGFNTHHRAFDSTTIVTTWDFIHHEADVTNPDCPEQGINRQDWHGTLTFSALGGYVPDTLIGVAFGASFALAKTEITCDGTEIKIEEDNWIAASEWADSLGADVISSSLGYDRFQDSGSYTMADLNGKTAKITIAADIAASKNILVSTAAGNERGTTDWPTIIFPADGDSVMAVGAVRPDSSIADFSSPGPTADGRIKPDVSTLGVDVYSALTGGGFTYASGTSLSTPLAAGVAALAFDFDSTLTAMQFLNLARQTASRVRNLNHQPDNNYGYGLIDAGRAADVARIVVADTVFVDSLHGTDVPVSTRGRSSQTPSITAMNLPPGALLVDSGNGRGSLHLEPLPAGVAWDTLRLAANITNFADTTPVVLSSSTPITVTKTVIAYPNPFSTSVTIVRGSVSGKLQGITIFNSAGEKVWERVNISPGSSDTSIRWDGRNESGDQVAPGVYIAYVQSEHATEHVKLLKVE